MSQAAVESFLGRIITDSDFRRLAMRSTEIACQGLGLNISPSEMSYLKGHDFALMGAIAENIDDAIQRGTGS